MSRNYIASDYELMIDICKSEINFLKSSWQNMLGRPLVTLVCKNIHLGSETFLFIFFLGTSRFKLRRAFCISLSLLKLTFILPLTLCVYSGFFVGRLIALIRKKVDFVNLHVPDIKTIIDLMCKIGTINCEKN